MLRPPMINYVAIFQHPCRSTLKELIFVNVISFRQVTSINYHAPDLFHSQREFSVKPVQFSLMSIKIRKIFKTAHMIPMDMSGDSGNRLVRQLFYLVINIANTEAGINQKTAFGTVQKIAVRFLPMTVFADDVGIRVNAVYCKPIVHTFVPFKMSLPISIAQIQHNVIIEGSYSSTL